MSAAARTRVAMTAFVVALVGLSTLIPGDSFRGLASGALPVLLSFFVVIVVAEQFRLELPGALPTSALSASAGMALAVTTRVPGRAFVCSSAEVLVTAAAAQLCGMTILRLRGGFDPDDPDAALDVAIRIFGVAIATALAREVPLFSGSTLEMASYDWPGWQLALALMAIGTLTGVVEAPLRSAGRLGQDGVTWRRVALAEARTRFPMGTALTATGALVALSVSVLGVIAIPLVLSLLGLTDFAVRRFVHVREIYAQSLRALSRMPEAVGYVASGHAGRVARVASVIGEQMRLPRRELDTLVDVALLHDLGQLDLRRPLPRGATVEAAPSDQQRIADSSARLVRESGPPGPLADLLRDQAVPYYRVLSGREDVALGARIIKVANAFDDYGGRLGAGGEQDGQAGMERIYLGLGYEYDPRVVDALSHALERSSRAAM